MTTLKMTEKEDLLSETLKFLKSLLDVERLSTVSEQKCLSLIEKCKASLPPTLPPRDNDNIMVGSLKPGFKQIVREVNSYQTIDCIDGFGKENGEDSIYSDINITMANSPRRFSHKPHSPKQCPPHLPKTPRPSIQNGDSPKGLEGLSRPSIPNKVGIFQQIFQKKDTEFVSSCAELSVGASKAGNLSVFSPLLTSDRKWWKCYCTINSDGIMNVYKRHKTDEAVSYELSIDLSKHNIRSSKMNTRRLFIFTLAQQDDDIVTFEAQTDYELSQWVHQILYYTGQKPDPTYILPNPVYRFEDPSLSDEDDGYMVWLHKNEIKRIDSPKQKDEMIYLEFPSDGSQPHKIIVPTTTGNCIVTTTAYTPINVVPSSVGPEILKDEDVLQNAGNSFLEKVRQRKQAVKLGKLETLRQNKTEIQTKLKDLQEKKSHIKDKKTLNRTSNDWAMYETQYENIIKDQQKLHVELEKVSADIAKIESGLQAARDKSQVANSEESHREDRKDVEFISSPIYTQYQRLYDCVPDDNRQTENKTNKRESKKKSVIHVEFPELPNSLTSDVDQSSQNNDTYTKKYSPTAMGRPNSTYTPVTTSPVTTSPRVTSSRLVDSGYNRNCVTVSSTMCLVEVGAKPMSNCTEEKSPDIFDRPGHRTPSLEEVSLPNVRAAAKAWGGVGQ